MHVLKGGFNFETCGTWGDQDRRILVFISSTFTDTTEERDWLIESIVPEVRRRFPGVDFKMVDMRFGVKDDNTLQSHFIIRHGWYV